MDEIRFVRNEGDVHGKALFPSPLRGRGRRIGRGAISGGRFVDVVHLQNVAERLGRGVKGALFRYGVDDDEPVGPVDLFEGNAFPLSDLSPGDEGGRNVHDLDVHGMLATNGEGLTVEQIYRERNALRNCHIFS